MNSKNLFNLNILDLPAFTGLPKERRLALIENASQEILERTLEKIAKALPETEQKKFLNLFTNSSSEEEKSSFLKNQVLPYTNVPKILLAEIINLKRKLGDVKN